MRRSSLLSPSARSSGAPTHAGLPGVAVAGVTAVVSGISVFVNSYGVHHVPSAAVYTTAKNLIAAVLLAVAAGLGRAVARLVFNSRHPDDAAGPETIVGSTDSIGARQTTTRGEPTGPCQWALARWAALAYVGAIGGGAAFVLFFEGLARTTAEPAAFLHDTLVIWVALLALPFLRERLSPWNVGRSYFSSAARSRSLGVSATWLPERGS